MKVTFKFYRKKPFYTQVPIELIPYFKITYIKDVFLETGINSKAILIEFGILKWKYFLLCQEEYEIETKSSLRDKKIKKLLK